MALTYTRELMGVVQLIDRNGIEFQIELRKSNAFAMFIYVSKAGDGKWLHMLYAYFVDEAHLKRYLKDCKKLFIDEIKSIRLNLRYGKCNKLLKHLTMNGYEVICYYE